MAMNQVDVATAQCGHTMHLSCIIKNIRFTTCSNGDNCPECRSPYFKKITLTELYNAVDTKHPHEYGSFETFCWLLQKLPENIGLPRGFTRKVSGIDILNLYESDEMSNDDNDDDDDDDSVTYHNNNNNDDTNHDTVDDTVATARQEYYRFEYKLHGIIDEIISKDAI
jgi:hypothetical protein